MYEQIDLDAIESNKDEAPDYRPFLKSSAPGAPVNIEYRMRYLSTLESEEKASYGEFAKIADSEGLRKVAGVFKKILEEEKEHEKRLKKSNETMMNLRTSVQREKDKIKIMEDIIDEAYREKDTKIVSKLKGMVGEEQGHVTMLEAALTELEKKQEKMNGMMKKDSEKRAGDHDEHCNYGVCVPNGKGELPDDTTREIVE